MRLSSALVLIFLIIGFIIYITMFGVTVFTAIHLSELKNIKIIRPQDCVELSKEEALKIFPEGMVRLAEIYKNETEQKYPVEDDLFRKDVHWGLVLKKSDNSLWIGKCYKTIFGENVAEPEFLVGSVFTHVIEKVNDTTYRVIVVIRNDKITHDNLVIDYYVSTKPLKGYEDAKDTGWCVIFDYHNIYRIDNCTWSVGNYSGEVAISVFEDTNPKDNEIIQTIARQIKEFAERNNLNKTQIIYYTLMAVSNMLVHEDNGKVYIYENGTFKPSDVNITDSIIARDVLMGTVCRGFSEWASSILAELGIRAFSYSYYPNDMPSSAKGIGHVRVGILLDDVDVNYLEDLITVPSDNIAIVNLSACGSNFKFIIIEPQTPRIVELKGAIDHPLYRDRKHHITMYVHGPNAKRVYTEFIKKICKGKIPEK